MQCNKCQDLLYEYLDATLPPDLQKAVEEHLEQCPTCRGMLEQERQFLQSMAVLFERQTHALRLDPKIRQNALARLQRRTALTVLFGRRPREIMKIAAILAILLAGFCGGNILWQKREDDIRAKMECAGQGPFKDLPISPVSFKDAVGGKSVTLVLVKDFMRMENSGPTVKDVEFERYFPVVDGEQIVLGRWVIAQADDGQTLPVSLVRVAPDSEGNLIHTWRLSSFPAQCQVLTTVSSLVGRRERPLPVGKYSIPAADKYPPAVQKFLTPTAMVASEHPEIKAVAEKLLQETKDSYILAQNLAKIMKAKSYTAPADADFSSIPTAVAIQRWGGSCCGSAVSAIAILRACGIPAQITYCPGGYIHGITRFYIQDYGWIRMDSTCGAGKLPLVQEPEDLGLARLFDMPLEMENELANYAWPYYHNDTQGEYRFLVDGVKNEQIRFASRPARQEKNKGPADGYVAEPYPHYEPGTWNRVLGSEPAEGLRQSWDKIASTSRKAVLEKKTGAFAEVADQLPKAGQYVGFVEKEIKLESGIVRETTSNTSEQKKTTKRVIRKGYELGGDFTRPYTDEGIGYIKAIADKPSDWTTMTRGMQADQYRGKRVRMSAFLKTEDVQGWAGLWMRVAGPKDKCLAFDSMQGNCPIKGTSDWKKYEVILDVPEESIEIYYGVILDGKGQVWIGDLKFEAVGKDVPTTEPLFQRLMRRLILRIRNFKAHGLFCFVGALLDDALPKKGFDKRNPYMEQSRRLWRPNLI